MREPKDLRLIPAENIIFGTPLYKYGIKRQLKSLLELSRDVIDSSILTSVNIPMDLLYLPSCRPIIKLNTTEIENIIININSINCENKHDDKIYNYKYGRYDFYNDLCYTYLLDNNIELVYYMLAIIEAWFAPFESVVDRFLRSENYELFLFGLWIYFNFYSEIPGDVTIKYQKDIRYDEIIELFCERSGNYPRDGFLTLSHRFKEYDSPGYATDLELVNLYTVFDKKQKQLYSEHPRLFNILYGSTLYNIEW